MPVFDFGPSDNLKSKIENPNSLLLAHLAAASDDGAIVRAMSSAVFGLTGEFGAQGFGATTLEGHLVLFTQPDFYAVAGLPPSLEAVEATARQAAEYAQAVGLFGFILNPGTHQRFVAGDAVRRLLVPLLAPEPPVVPTLVPWADPSRALVQAITTAAEGSSVESVWLAQGMVVVTRPHPDPAFEAALLAQDVRMRSFGSEPSWEPVFRRDAPATARIRLAALSQPLPAGLASELSVLAERHGLAELWAFEAKVADGEPTLAFAYSPHPHDAFAAELGALHARRALGPNSLLLDAETLREALPRIGTRLR